MCDRCGPFTDRTAHLSEEEAEEYQAYLEDQYHESERKKYDDEVEVQYAAHLRDLQEREEARIEFDLHTSGFDERITNASNND